VKIPRKQISGKPTKRTDTVLSGGEKGMGNRMETIAARKEAAFSVQPLRTQPGPMCWWKLIEALVSERPQLIIKAVQLEGISKLMHS
jgi:hypothetical protein